MEQPKTVSLEFPKDISGVILKHLESDVKNVERKFGGDFSEFDTKDYYFGVSIEEKVIYKDGSFSSYSNYASVKVDEDNKDNIMKQLSKDEFEGALIDLKNGILELYSEMEGLGERQDLIGTYGGNYARIFKKVMKTIVENFDDGYEKIRQKIEEIEKEEPLFVLDNL